MTDGRIGVIMGGDSSEREVSLRSGEAVVDALESVGCRVVPIVLQRSSDAYSLLQNAHLDVAFLALHGRYGEDGCIQGLLEMLRIPYTGAGVLSSALAMDKVKSKELFRLHNLPTPPYYCIHASQLDRLGELHGSFGFPVIVKPRREGSSVGVCKVNHLGELAAAVERATAFDGCALVERFIEGKEVAVGLLEGRVLGAIEIVPHNESGVFDYRAKYQAHTTEYFLPARLSSTRYRGVLNLAERAASSLECRGAVRVDLIVTEGQNEYVLEVNTLPGMTETSLLPKIARAAGLDFASLCVAIARSARLELTLPRTGAPATEQDVELVPERAPVRVAV